MTEGDGAAVGVDDRPVEPGPLGEARQHLGRERLVELDDRQVGPADSRPGERPRRRHHRAQSVQVWLDGRHRPGRDAGERRMPQPLDRDLTGQQQGGGVVEQVHHPMHHLFPRVPWYRYRRLCTEMRPLPETNNARIEGRRFGADVPKIALR